jgi:thioesterase domain-containing protein
VSLPAPKGKATRGLACSTVLEFQRGTGVPVVCWHTLSDDLETYQNLTRQLGDRTIFGVVSPSVTQDTALTATVEQIVADGLAALRQSGLTESSALVGYSWGGLLAFEAARQLTLAGMPPPYVGLIGTAPPLVRRSRVTRLLHLLRLAPTRAWTVFRHGRSNPDDPLSTTLLRAGRLLLAKGAAPDARIWKSPREQAHVQIGFAYNPQPVIPVKIHLFRELALRHHVDHLGYIRFDQPDFGWHAWAGVAPTVLWVEGHHNHIMGSESVEQIAALMQMHLDGQPQLKT